MLAMAIGLLVAIQHYGPDSTVATYGYGVWLTVLVLTGALIASLWPTALTREGLVLLWNGLGLSLGLLAIGLLGVSSLLALPPVLLGLAVSAWPRWPGQPLAPVSIGACWWEASSCCHCSRSLNGCGCSGDHRLDTPGPSR
jgi:hypothetical protein